MSQTLRLKKDDLVIVRSGKYKGKTGKIIATSQSTSTVTVEGINIVKKHQKPNKQYPQGGIIEITKPIDISKVGLYEPTLKKASRVRYMEAKDGTKTRLYVACGKEVKHG